MLVSNVIGIMLAASMAASSHPTDEVVSGALPSTPGLRLEVPGQPAGTAPGIEAFAACPSGYPVDCGDGYCCASDHPYCCGDGTCSSTSDGCGGGGGSCPADFPRDCGDYCCADEYLSLIHISEPTRPY